MKFLVLIATLAALIYISNGEPVKTERGCTVEGSFVKVGDTFQPPGKCELAECKGNNKITTLACAERDSAERCFKKPVNTALPYPDCCPQWLCN